MVLGLTRLGGGVDQAAQEGTQGPTCASREGRAPSAQAQAVELPQEALLIWPWGVVALAIDEVWYRLRLAAKNRRQYARACDR